MKTEADFNNWNIIKKETDSFGSKNFKHGEVYWCRLGVNIGVEIDGKGQEYLRPIIVLKKFSNECLLAAPITTKLHVGNWYYKIKIQDKDCEVVLIQIKLIDSKRLTQKSICQLSNRKIRKILRRYKILIST
jgi:mRNA-degrading endonuclease toxin of MazEF toxin-antitoxin module